MSAGSGPKSNGPFAWFDRDGSCWRTFQVSFTGECTPCSGALPPSGTLRNGKLYPRRKSALPISAIASGLWATPSASDSRGSHGGGQGRSLRTDMANLKATGKAPAGIEPRWPTPTVTDARDMPARTKVSRAGLGETPSAKHALSLMVAVKVWPTPTVTGNHNRKGLRKTSGDGLSTAVKREMMPTPTATDGKRNGRMMRGNHSLPSYVKDMVPTPTKSDGAGGVRLKRRSTKQGQPLREFVVPQATMATDQLGLFQDAPEREQVGSGMLPTPNSRDWKDTGSQEMLARAGAKHQRTLPRHVAMESTEPDSLPTGSLNPRWVVWLMGFPTAWLNLKRSATPSSRKSRSRTRSKSSTGKNPRRATREKRGKRSAVQGRR